MKNLMIYIGKTKGFDLEHEQLTKMQIDNSLELGWKVEDIVLVTDFDWEYRGVSSLVVHGNFDVFDGNRSSKIPVIDYLFTKRLIGNDTYWFHDHDAFQLSEMRDPDIRGYDIGITNHGWSKKWNAGSFFFNKLSWYVFTRILSCMAINKLNEQDSLTSILDDPDIHYKLLNITYNLNINNLEKNIKKADKPLLVAHFHPHKKRHLDLFREYLPERLIKIFNSYGLK